MILKNEIFDNKPRKIPTGQITLQYQRFLKKLSSVKNSSNSRDRNKASLKPLKILPLSPKGSRMFRKKIL